MVLRVGVRVAMAASAAFPTFLLVLLLIHLADWRAMRHKFEFSVWYCWVLRVDWSSILLPSLIIILLIANCCEWRANSCSQIGLSAMPAPPLPLPTPCGLFCGTLPSLSIGISSIYTSPSDPVTTIGIFWYWVGSLRHPVHSFICCFDAVTNIVWYHMSVLREH